MSKDIGQWLFLGYSGCLPNCTAIYFYEFRRLRAKLTKYTVTFIAYSLSICSFPSNNIVNFGLTLLDSEIKKIKTY